MKIMFGVIAAILCSANVHAYTIVDAKTVISDGHEGSIVEHFETSDSFDENSSNDKSFWDGEEE